jgi:hypothetical protein
MNDIQPLLAEEIGALPRSTVRYALFRRKSGVPDEAHWKIINYYEPRVLKYGLIWSDFSDVWDLSKENNLDIVSGHIVHLYKEESSSLFNEDGTLKE